MIIYAIAQLIREATGFTKQQVKPTTEQINVYTTQHPLVLYSELDARRNRTDDGTTGIVHGLYQLDIFAADVVTAKQIAATIRTELDGYSGNVAETDIQLIEFSGDRFGESVRAEGQNRSVGRYIVRMPVIYRE